MTGTRWCSCCMLVCNHSLGLWNRAQCCWWGKWSDPSRRLEGSGPGCENRMYVWRALMKIRVLCRCPGTCTRLFLSMSKWHKKLFSQPPFSCDAFCQLGWIKVEGDPQIVQHLDENIGAEAVSRDLYPCRGLRTKRSANLSWLPLGIQAEWWSVK